MQSYSIVCGYLCQSNSGLVNINKMLELKHILISQYAFNNLSEFYLTIQQKDFIFHYMLSLLAYFKSDPSPFSLEQNSMPGSWIVRNYFFFFLEKRRIKPKQKRKGWYICNYMKTDNTKFKFFFKGVSLRKKVQVLAWFQHPVISHLSQQCLISVFI